MATNNRQQLQYRFWLDAKSQRDQPLIEKVDNLKRKRLFTQTIRDGIKLITNLREGKLDVLFELFPWVKAEFMEYMRELQPTPTEDTLQIASNTPEIPAIPPTEYLQAEQERLEAERQWHEKRVADAEKALEAERQKIESERTQGQQAIQEQLDRLEQLLLQQDNQPIGIGLQPIGSKKEDTTQPNSIQSLSVPQFTTPTYDDDDDDLILDVTQAKGDGQANQNFLRSMQALQK